MKRRTGRRILSVLLALVMMLSLLPASVFASDTVTARKISSADQLTSGQYVLVNEAGYASTAPAYSLSKVIVNSPAVSTTSPLKCDLKASILYSSSLSSGLGATPCIS